MSNFTSQDIQYAEREIRAGEKNPYDDERDEDASSWEFKAARGIVSELSGRGGFAVFDELDAELREEIIDVIAAIVHVAEKNR